MVHPIDKRYLVRELVPFISDEAFLGYKLRVEAAHAKALAKHGVCPIEVASEIEEKARIETVKPSEVESMEKALRHDIRAMVETLASKVSDRAKPYVHLGLTSYDVVNTAQVLMIRDATYDVILPDMTSLLEKMVDIAVRERSTVQIGRTHGQHAEPTTFGKEMAVFVDRWGRDIERVIEAVDGLRGKAGGAVGTKASLSLLGDPDEIERTMMNELGIEPATIATQIVPAEDLTNYFAQITIAFGTLADMANSMRHLQRSEIAEVLEHFEARQIGSSTMPQKRNPISWENIISQYRAVMPHIVTSLLNIESDHQRDLRDSAANRYLIAEVLDAFDYSVTRSRETLSKIVVDGDAMKRNLQLDGGSYLAEPAYIILALSGVPNAHEYVRKLVVKSRNERKSLSEVLLSDATFQEAVEKLPPETKAVLSSPDKYIGSSEKLVDQVTSHWRSKVAVIKRRMTQRRS